MSGYRYTRGMAKLTVYLPDSLQERLERVRDRLNASELCQKALERAIVREELALSGDRTAKVIDRLRRVSQRPAWVYDQGRLAGQRWAEEKATWDQIREVVDWKPEAITGHDAVDESPDGATWLGVALLAGGKELRWPEGLPDPDEALTKEDRRDSTSHVAYAKGVYAGVRGVYDSVRAQVETDE